MKAKIIKENHQFYNHRFDVLFLSYNTAAGMDLDSQAVVAAQVDEIEFLYDAPWEEEIITNREVLNITKPKEASYYMYYIVLKSIEQHLDNKITDFIVVDDSSETLKGVWLKKVKLVVNGRPLMLSLTGKKYSNVFDIKVVDINSDEFIESCEQKIKELKIGLKKYTKRINGLVYTIQLIKRNKEVYNQSEVPKIANI